jgi:putative hydrolase of the HAD superfamily
MSKQPKWDLVEGIVLDAVGTLIKPTPSVADAYTEAADRQGVVLDRDDVRRRFQRTFRDDAIRADRGIHSTDETIERRRWREIVAQVLPEVPDPQRAFDELWDHFGRPESWRCFPDAAPALRAFHEAGIEVCIGSNFDARLRCVVAGLPELAAMVDGLVVSSEVGYRKPHRAFFEAVSERLDLPPERILSVGDDLENDVRGAIRAGLSAVYLDRGQEAPDDVPHVATLTMVAELRAEEALKFGGRV